MINRIIICLLILALSHFSMAQRVIPVAQRKKIDSLYALSKTLTGAEKANCLIRLCKEYGRYNSDTSQHWNWWNPDSAKWAAKEALIVSSRINYYKGMGQGFASLGYLAVDNDFVTSEKYLRQAITLLEAAKADADLSGANAGLGWALYAQARYEESITAEEKALAYQLLEGHQSAQSTLYRMIGFNYGMQGYREKEFEYTRLDDSVQKQMKNVDAKTAVYSPLAMGRLYDQSGDHEKALYYFRLSAAAEARHYKFPELIHEDLAEAFVNIGQYDSAAFYAQLARKEYHVGNFSLGDAYFGIKKYDSALHYFLEFLDIKKKQHDINQVMFTLRNIANVYQAMNRFDASFPIATELKELGTRTHARFFIKYADDLLYKYYVSKKNTDSAFSYFKAFSVMKDSLQENEFIKKMAVYEMQSKQEQQQTKIDLLSKENQLKESAIKREQLIRNIIIGALIAGLLLAILALRNAWLSRRRLQMQQQVQVVETRLATQEKKERMAQLEMEKTQLEMQVLRAQMNPHFIFNSLNSINRFIVKDNSGQASQYLTKFSKLIRMILQNSQESFITLENELEALELYLDLESLRFSYHFRYKINIDPELDLSMVKVPPLIIQPFVENAIWHGLMHKEEKGLLSIDLRQDGDDLVIRIADDGIGRRNADLISHRSDTLHQSMGIGITQGRISILKTKNREESPITFNDLVNADGSAAGTEVFIKIPLIYD